MSDLLSYHIIEKDNNDDILWTWTYPSIIEKEKLAVLRKCTFEFPNFFGYGRHFAAWYYINCLEVPDNANLSNIKAFACVICAKDFSPDKYEKLCQIMCKTYSESGNPLFLLQLYLNVITKGACSAKENGTFLVKEYGLSKFPQKTELKDLIKLFGLEIILVYTAILLKKRLAVYHHSLSALMKWIPTFLVFVSHRNIIECLFPWTDLTTDDLLQLKVRSSFIAGFCDNGVINRPDLYDVIINIPAQEISVSPHAKESLMMTKIHKDIAISMVQLCESDASETLVIKAVADKTQELIANIRSLGKLMEDGNFWVSVETIKEKNVSPAMENFLFQLALAENMLLL